MTLSTEGSTAISAVLESIALEIKEDLGHLHQLFRDELIPRCTRIGNALARARSQFRTSELLYEWTEATLGIKGRQVRTYLRFTDRLPVIEAAAEEQGVEITSMEQGLALLAPARVELALTDREVKAAAVAQAVGRAKGALGRALEAIYDLQPSGLTARELEVLQAATDLLTSWGNPSAGPLPVAITPLDGSSGHRPPELAVDRQPQPEWEELPTEVEEITPTATTSEPIPVGGPIGPDPELSAKGSAAGLPMHLKPGQWSLVQLEEGVELYGGQAALATAVGVSRSAINGQLKAKRKAVGLSEE
jgi:hypothetical protein